ncbi:hypothetical protein ASG43_12430 [Aureimonas sp. Leaf454]|uniref:hypothetical protein n=1 Tax=Aureimonas sp. Leaf454 TaxID=1736381 RepID=UPI0006FB0144|nr:hypothetical protein [Aureimonas sp. Leaf454]KQT45106.1 hypothetical protein ASG43_12430 [Aureimonas sp. Leaf454]
MFSSFRSPALRHRPAAFPAAARAAAPAMAAGIASVPGIETRVRRGAIAGALAGGTDASLSPPPADRASYATRFPCGGGGGSFV